MNFRCVATLGPSSLHLVRRLLAAGADLFRLNTSHMNLEAIEQTIRAVRSEVGDVALLLDLQGAKMRLGKFPSRSIASGSEVVFALSAQARDSIPVPHRELFDQTKLGDTLSLDDDRLRLQIVRIERGSITARSLETGVLRPRKGINVAEHPIELRDLNSYDAEVCALARRFPAVNCAVSFVSNGREADWIRRRLPGREVIAKVERAEAIAALHEISARFDAIWICRGDLGSQLGTAAMARFVGGFDPCSVPKPILMAGQVLEHLTHHSKPTRSEVCHLHDLVARGYAGIVLSDETAIGKDPERAVRIASSLIRDFCEADESGG